MAVVTDSIADMLTRIRNATQRRHSFVSMPSSNMKVAVARIMKDEGFIDDYQVIDEKPQAVLQIWPKYTAENEPVLTGMKRVSTPGRRVYRGRHDIPWVLSGMGIVIVSTSRGVITGRQARRKGVGGEIVCYVW
ncbi:MAG: 30S ribosomal protein S8 [Anaerolineae bacterium]